MDKVDLLIIQELQREADRTIYQLAKQIGLKRSTVYNRIKKLKEQGVIKGYHAVVDYAKVGRPIHALVLVRHKKTTRLEDLFKEIVKQPEVEAVYSITGSFDVIIVARFKDVAEMSSFIMKKLSKPSLAQKITRTETIMTLGSFKEYFRKP